MIRIAHASVLAVLALAAGPAAAQVAKEEPSRALPLDGPEAAAARRTLDALVVALAKDDGAAYVQCFDLERLRHALRGSLSPGQLRALESPNFLAGVRDGMAQTVSSGRHPMHWEAYDLQYLERALDGSTLLAFARHRGAKGAGVEYIRWYLCRGPDGYRVWDLEGVLLGVRTTAQMAAMIPDGPRPNLAAHRALQQLSAVKVALQGGDAAKAETILDDIAPDVLPPEMDRQRHVLRAAICVATARSEEALAALDLIDASDSLVVKFLRAQALVALERFVEAEPFARDVVARLPDEPVANNALAAIHFHAGRSAEAVACFRQAADSDPHNADHLLGLAHTLPADGDSEIATRFRRLADPVAGLDYVGTGLLDAGRHERLLALIPVARDTTGDHALVDFFHGLARQAQGDLAAALPLLERAAKRAPVQYPGIVARYCAAMVDAGRALDAYRAVRDPREAFQELAWGLYGREQWEPLGQLAAAHRARVSDDVWLLYFDAQLALHAGQATDAERLLSEGLARATDEESRADFRTELVAVMAGHGRWREAYERFRDADAFAQVAGVLQRKPDPGALLALCGLQAQARPDDPTLPLWRAEAKAGLGDHAGAIAVLEPRRAGLEADPELLGWFESRWIRSLARLKRIDEAVAAATRSTARDGDPWYEVVVLAIQGDAPGVAKRLRELAAGGAGPAQFWADPDVAEALQSPAFAKVREEFPPPG